jgi:hypothetical protein
MQRISLGQRQRQHSENQVPLSAIAWEGAQKRNGALLPSLRVHVKAVHVELPAAKHFRPQTRRMYGEKACERRRLRTRT